MKKTATILALAGLSMAAKTEHSFLGRKPVEIKAEIDPKMVIKPAHDIDPGMVRKPNRNIDQGMIMKPRKPQGTISADDDELLLIYRPPHDIDPKMVIKPRDDIDPGMVINPFKPKKIQGTVLYADDNDDELLSIYMPAYNVDPGMVRRPPVGSDIDPKFVIKPPRGFDDGIYVRPRPRGEPVWVDDEMRLVAGTEVDPGMVIKPRRGDIDPGMIRKPVKGWEIDPKILVKPKRGDVLYADDDELAVVGHVREPRLIGDFPINWPGKPIYADAEDNELRAKLSDQGIPRRPFSQDDELVYASGRIDSGMVRKPLNGNIDKGIFIRPKDNIKYFDAENDDELAVVGHVKEPRLIGDFPINWPGKPVYADAEDNELGAIVGVSDQGIPSGKHDDELFEEQIKKPAYSDAVSDPRFPMRPGCFNARDDELAIRPIGQINRVQTQTQDDELVQMTEFVREPRYAGETHGKSAVHADDELVYASNANRIDSGMVRKPYFESVDDGIWKRPMGSVRYFDAENDDELAFVAEKLKQIKEPRLIGDFPINWPGQPVYADDELILFADYSLDNKPPRKGIFDPRELTKPWYQQQQTMYADDADNELVGYRKAVEKSAQEEKPTKANDLKTFKLETVNRVKPPKRPVQPVKEADDEFILFADGSLDARLDKRRVPIDLKEMTKPWYQQQHTMYADDSLVALGELLEDN